MLSHSDNRGHKLISLCSTTLDKLTKPSLAVLS